jgi:hypothetical protein
MQRKQACCNGGGLSLRRDVMVALIRKKMIKMNLSRPFYNKQDFQKTLNIQKPNPRR